MKAQASVSTERAAHYIKKLCLHFDRKANATFNEARGDVQFEFGAAELVAESDRLVLSVSADDAERLARIKDVVGGHLERFASRGEMITVTWADVG